MPPHSRAVNRSQHLASGGTEETWHALKAASNWIVILGGNEYVMTPEGPEKKVLQVQGDNTDPIEDSGKNKPVSKNPAPPAAPFPAKVAPNADQVGDDKEDGSDDGDTTSDPPDPKPRGNGDVDPSNDEYVGSSLTAPNPVDPAKLSNPEAGGLAPNPNNPTVDDDNDEDDTANDSSDQDGVIDSQDTGHGLPIDEMQWQMGSHRLVVDAKTGLAKWPLTFERVEKDFKRPNKVKDPNAEPKCQNTNDAEELGDKNKPYQTGSPPI